MLLSGYTFRIEHTKGKDNIPADRLSRIYLPASDEGLEESFDRMLMNIDVSDGDQQSQNESADDDAEDFGTDEQEQSTDEDIAAGKDMNFASSYDIAQLQEQCADCRSLLHYLRDGILPRDDQVARKTVYQAEHYVSLNGILYHLLLPRGKVRRNSRSQN